MMICDHLCCIFCFRGVRSVGFSAAFLAGDRHSGARDGQDGQVTDGGLMCWVS